MKRWACIAVLLLGVCLTSSGRVRLSGGVSWGYSPQIYKGQVFSYIPNRIGYRINERESAFNYYSNAYLDADAGVDLWNRVSFHLKTGYRGLDYNYDIVPLLLESRFYFKDYYTGGAFVALEAGTALHEWNFDDGIILIRTSLGYREQLYRNLSVDFLFHIQAADLHPLPIDKYEGVIPRPQVSFSAVGYLQIGFGVGISF